MRLIIYLMIICSSFGKHIFSTNVGSFQLTAYRLLLFFLFVFELLKNRGKIFKRDKVYTFLRVLLLYSVITIIWVKSVSNWIQYEFFIVSALFVLYIIYNNASDVRFIKNCLIAFNISVTIQAFIGFIEVFTKRYWFIDSSLEFYYTRFGEFPPVAMLYNCNNFGLYMLIGVSISVALLFTSHRFFEKAVHIAQILFFSYMTVLSTSRGCLVGLLLIAVFVCFLLIKNKTVRALIVISACLAGVSIYLFRGDFDISYYEDVSRVALIKHGFSLLGDSFGFGIGSGQVSYWLRTRFGGVEALHNWWMEILVTYGIVMFLYYAYTYFLMIRRINKMILQDADTQVRGICIGLIAFLLSFAFSSLTVSNVMSLEWFWVLWAICVTMSSYSIDYRITNN